MSKFKPGDKVILDIDFINEISQSKSFFKNQFIQFIDHLFKKDGIIENKIYEVEKVNLKLSASCIIINGHKIHQDYFKLAGNKYKKLKEIL